MERFARFRCGFQNRKTASQVPKSLFCKNILFFKKYLGVAGNHLVMFDTQKLVSFEDEGHIYFLISLFFHFVIRRFSSATVFSFVSCGIGDVRHAEMSFLRR